MESEERKLLLKLEKEIRDLEKELKGSSALDKRNIKKLLKKAGAYLNYIYKYLLVDANFFFLNRSIYLGLPFFKDGNESDLKNIISTVIYILECTLSNILIYRASHETSKEKLRIKLIKIEEESNIDRKEKRQRLQIKKENYNLLKGGK